MPDLSSRMVVAVICCSSRFWHKERPRQWPWPRPWSRPRPRPRPRPKKLFTCSCNETGVHPSTALNGGTSVVSPCALALWLVGLIFWIFFICKSKPRPVIGWLAFCNFFVYSWCKESKILALRLLDLFWCRRFLLLIMFCMFCIIFWIFTASSFFMKTPGCSPLLLHTRGMLRPFLPPEQRAYVSFTREAKLWNPAIPDWRT